MKNSRFFLSTLFAAAALSVAPALPALADGDGTSSSPYSGSITNLDLSYNEGTGTWAAGTTVYINGITSGYWANKNMTVVANIDIGSDGLALTDGYSGNVYTFAGAITGTGNWTFTGASNSTPTQHYVFTGDLSNYSGNFSMTAGGSSGSEGYLQFGDGGQAATNTNVSGTGSITEATTGSGFAVIYNYGSLASGTETAITIGNTSITTPDLQFTGSVDYIVSSALAGTGSNAKLTISNLGTTTLNGNVSDFSTININTGSTVAVGANASLDLSSATVNLSATIQNSGTVTLNSDTKFVLDTKGLTSTGWSNGSATYTLIASGGKIEGYDSSISISASNIYNATSSVSYDESNGTLTITFTDNASADGLHGSGESDNPYYTTGTTSAISISSSIFTGAGTTVYLASDTQSLGNSSENVYWNGTFTAACDIVIGKAGVYLTNGSAGNQFTFTGAISGEGSLTADHVKDSTTGYNVRQRYAFTGDLSGWSGNLTISTENVDDYVAFGGTINLSDSFVSSVTGTQAATNTSVSGTGAIAVDYGTVHYAYTAGANGQTGETLTVTNTSIEAHTLIFGGGVNYNVSSELIGYDPSNYDGAGDHNNDKAHNVSETSSLIISTTGKVTLSGTASGFDVVTVNEGSTLAIASTGSLTIGGTMTVDGTLDVASAITVADGGSVTISDNAIFVLNDAAGTTSGNSTIYTIFSLKGSGTLEGWTDLDYTNFVLSDGTAIESAHQITINADGTVTYTPAATVLDLVWNGQEGDVWTAHGNAVWYISGTTDSTTFGNGDSVTFGAEGATPTVIVSGTIEVESVTVNGDYTFTTDGDAVLIDIGDSLTVASGATLTIDSGITVFIKHEESTFSVDGTINGSGTLELEFGSGYSAKVNLGSNSTFSGIIYIYTGTFDLTGSNIGNGTYEVADGVNFQADGSTTTNVNNGIIFDGTSQLHVNSGGTLNVYGVVSGSGTLDKEGAGTLVLAGGADLNKLTLSAGSIKFDGAGKTYNITEIAKGENNNETTLEVASGTTVNAGSMSASWHIGTIQVDGTLNISRSIVLGSGSAETFTGTGTVTVGTLQVGHSSNSSNAGSIKVDGGLTLIADAVTKGASNNSYIEFDNATIGTSNSDGLTFASTVTSFTLSAEAGSATTFNTNLYDVDAGVFTSTATTITIAANISGTGALVVDGAGSLVISGSDNSGFTGNVTVNSGATLDVSSSLTISNEAKIAGTVEIGGTLAVASGAQVTLDNTLGSSTSAGTVEFATGASLIISDSFLNSGISITIDDNTGAASIGGSITVIDAGTIIFGSTTIGSSTDLSSLLESFIVYDSRDYTLTWVYSDGALVANFTSDMPVYLLPLEHDSSSSPSATSGVMAAGYYVIDPNGNGQGWIAPVGTTAANNQNVSFEEGSYFYGEGLLGITAKQGSGDNVETFDLTNVDASNLTGQLIVMNEWNNEADIKILGDSWANVEFLFGNAADDDALAEKYGLTDVNRGDLSSDFSSKGLNDYLALQGDTTFAGVTGATKGTTIYDKNSNPTVLCDHEFITVVSNGTTLTIAGSKEYAFYGTAGTNSNRVTLSMTGTGSQTFGGTNYLQNVVVEAGTLVLSSTTDIAGNTLVSGGKLIIGSVDSTDTTNFSGNVTVYEGAELDIYGEVTISTGISSTGTVVIDDSATFILDSLTVQTDSATGTNYYEIVSSGTVSGDLSVSNFYVDGSALSSRWVVYTSDGGLYIYRTQTADLIWAGTEDVHSWTTAGALDWQDGETFNKGDSVIFDSTADCTTVTIAEAIEANSVRVTGADYTFDFYNGSVTASSLTIESDASLALTGTGSLTATTATIEGSISLGEGTTLDLSSISYYDLEDIGIANITGTGKLVVAGSDVILGFDLNKEFTGTLSVASGYLDVCASSTNATAFELAGGTSLVVQTDGWNITQDVSFTGSGTANLRPSNATGIVISGDVTGTSGVTVEKYGAGDITFTGTVALEGTYYAYQGTTTFAGETSIGTLNAGNQNSVTFTGSSATVGTLNFNNAGFEVDFSGDGNYTVGAVTISENSTLSGTVTITGNMTRSGGTLFTIAEGSDVTVEGTFVSAQQNASGTTTALEKDAKLTVETMTNNWGANFTLAEGSVLTVATATFTPGNTACTVSGSGTWIAETFNFGNGANYTLEGIILDVGTMEVGVYPGGTNLTVNALTLTDVTATIDNLNIYVSTPLTFNGGSAEITSVFISNNATVTFTGGGNYTMGSYILANDGSTYGSTLAIGDDTTVTIGDYEAHYHQNTINLGEGATLTITTQMWFATANMEELTGGTFNIEQLTISNEGTIVSIHDAELYIGAGDYRGGIKNDDTTNKGYVLFGDNLTVGVYVGTSGTNTSWVTDSAIKLGGTGTGTTFVTLAGESITIAGIIADYTYNEDTETAAGNLTKTGAGTLTLTGENTFTGSVTLAEGTIKIGNSSSLGLGTITIGGDTTLASNTSSTVALSDKSFVIDGSSTFSGIVLTGTMTFDWAAGAQITLTDSGDVTGTGSVHFADDTDFTYDGVILFVGTSLTEGTDLSGWTASYNGEGYNVFGGTFSVDSNGNIVFVASDEFLDVYGSLVWDVTKDDQTWTDGTFQSTTGLSNDRNYLFNEKSTGATSYLSGEISTNRVTIASAAGEVKWAVADGATTASISGSELIIESGANLWVGTNESQTVALAFDEIKLGGKLTYQSSGDSWGLLEFTDNGAELYIENFKNSLSIDEVIVSADAKISSHWGYWAGYEDYSALKIGTLSGTGDLSITGPTGNEQTLAVEVGDMSNYSGTITLSDDEYDQSHGWSKVVFKLAGSSNAYEFADITIVVGAGGTLDANGQIDIGFNTVLAGGILTSSSSISNTNIQFPTITLTADSSVDAGSGVSFGMIARGYGESDLRLNGNTLTKTGEGTFFLLDTTVWGADENVEGSTGTLKISEGTLEMDGVIVKDTAVVVESGGKLSIASNYGYSSTTLDNLSSSGTVEIGVGATLELVSNTTLTGTLQFVTSNSVSGTLSVTSGAVVDLTGVTSQDGGNGVLSISGEGSTVKISNYAWGSSSNFGANMYNGLIQIADGGTLEITAAQSESGAGERAFSVTSGTGTYKFSGTGTSTSYIDSTERNIHLADDATLVFEVTDSSATLNVSMVIANGISTSSDVLDSLTTTTGSLEKTGAGKLILSGDNLYSGGTKISAGTLEATNASALGTGAVEIAEGASLILNAEDGTFNLAVSGEGSLTISAGTLAASDFTLTGTTTIEEGAVLDIDISSDTSLSGTIKGSGTLSKSGSGTLTITDNVTVTNIAMSAGTLAGLALETGMTATITGGTLDSFSMENGELIISATSSTSITGNSALSGGTISMTEAFESSTPYFTVADDVTITISGAVTFNIEDLVLSGTDASVVIFDSGVTFDGIDVNDLTLNYGGSGSGGDPHFNPDDMGFEYDEGTGSLSATIGLQSVELYWEGSSDEGGNILIAEGAQNLHDANGTYTFFLTGDTIYFDGDKVVQSSVVLGSDIDATAIIVQNGAEITLDSDNGTYALTGEGTLSVANGSSLTLKNAKHSYTGDTTVDGSLTLGITSDSGQLFASIVSGSGSLTLDIADGLEISIASNLTGDDGQLVAGSLTFIKSGDGTLVVDAAQTDFSGSVEIAAGTMVIGSSGLFGDSTSITIDEGATLEISADIDSLTETLSGAGTLLVDEGLTLVTEASNIAGLSGTTVLGDGVTLTLSNTSETEVTVGTAITGSNATLVKTGSGAVNLADDTTVTNITVSAGTLGNIALSDGMTLATAEGTGLSSVTMTGGTLDTAQGTTISGIFVSGGTLTAAQGTAISGITMEGGKLDASNVFEVTTDSITLSGSNSFSGGTVLLGEGTLLVDGVQSDPIVAAFVIESGNTVSVSGSVVFYIDNVELPDAIFDDEGKRIYTISYQVFDTTDGTLEGWTDLIYSNFAIDGVVLTGSDRKRVEISDDGSVKFYITDYDLTWNGGESGVWNTSDVVWTRDEGVYTESYDNGDSVTFTNDFGKLTITLGGDVNPSTLTVDKDADVTITGGEYKITGSKTTIVIEEDGKLTLTSGGNDFGGGVTINDGGELALKVSSNEAYLDGVEISLADGASGTFTIDTDANVTYETILKDTTLTDSENLTLVKDGSGTLTITSELGYKNLDLEVEEGTLAIATDGSVGSVDIKLSGSASLELENTDTETAKEITNSISGVGTATTIVKTGTGEIIIAGDNSNFSGSVEIYEGTLTLTSADALGSVSKTTIAEDGTLKLAIESDFDLDDIVGTISGSGTIEIDLGDEGVLHATSGYYGSDKFADFTGSFVVHGADNGTYTMEIDVSSTSRGSAIGDANVEIDENVNLVFNIQSAGYSYGGSISGKGTVSFNWDSTSSVSHTFSLTGDNSNFSGTIYIPEDIVLTAKGGNALGGEEATVDNSGELWIDEDDKSSVVSKLTGSGSLHKTGSGAVKIENGTNDLTGSLEIREGSLCFKYTDALGGITTASVSEGAVLEVEVGDSDNVLDVTVTGEGSVVIHGKEGNCIVPYAIDDGYSTDKITLASNDSSSYNGGLTIDSAYLITSKTSSYDSMNELGTANVTITHDSTWDASNGGFTASGSRTITIENHSRLLAGAFKAESGYYGSISISNIRIDSDADDAADLYISVTSSSDITRNYITGTGDGKIYMTGVDIYLDTTITSFGQITVIDTSEGLEIVGTPNVYINGELEAESYWINGVISQDSISEDVKKHGLSYAAMVVMPTEAFIQDVRTIHSRLEQRRFAFSREGEWEFFAQAQTIQEDSGSGSDSKSFDYQTYGAIVGADVRIDQTTIFGMALAYDHGDAKLHHSEGHIKMDDYRFTAFGSKVFANWLFVEGGAQFGIGSYDIRRRAGSTVGDNNGDTDGVNVGGFFTFGGVVPITDNIFLTPYIGLTYMYSHVDSFDETGSYGYKADGFNANSLRGKIGTQLRTELMLGDVPTALALGLSYAHEFIDDDIDYDVAAITYSDKKQSLTENAFTEDLISIGLSAEFGVSDSASVFMGYNADIGLGNSEVSHAVNAGLKVTF